MLLEVTSAWSSDLKTIQNKLPNAYSTILKTFPSTKLGIGSFR